MFFLYCNESANSMLTAVNSFLRYMEHPDCFVWQLKVPRTAYCSQDKKLKLEEYKRLGTLRRLLFTVGTNLEERAPKHATSGSVGFRLW